MANETTVATGNANGEDTNPEDVVDLEAEIEELGEDATPEDLKQQIKTLNAQKNHWRKKAKGDKGDKKEVTETKKEEVKTEDKSDSLSETDLFILVKSDVHQEDIQIVKDFAKLKNIGIQEALQNDVLKSILNDNTEKRNVANATNTGKSNKSNGAKSDADLLADSKKGIMPESDADIARLAELRLGIKK